MRFPHRDLLGVQRGTHRLKHADLPRSLCPPQNDVLSQECVDFLFTFTPTDAKKTFEFDIEVPTGSVDSGNANLDKHLMSPDFFNTKEHENMIFKSTEIERISQDVWDVVGNLTMNGVTKPVVALVRFVATKDMGKGQRAGFEATFDIKRSDFGIKYGIESGALGDQVHIVVAMEVVHDNS